MTDFSMRVTLEPVPKGRPRFTRSGHVYTPDRTMLFEKDFANRVRSSFKQKPFIEPLCVEFDLYCKRPKKLVKSYPRADCDNLIKSCLDALNGLIWVDDSQICEIVGRKQYAPLNVEPYIFFLVRPFIPTGVSD